ncbi:hypothetical protein LC040_13255 [Bacillus tianshenii]|nr:hypothetical protein LC040_13255 [Bacillus tianshenii]
MKEYNEETVKQRKLRQVFILICFAAVAGAFMWQANYYSNSKKEEFFYGAGVVQVGTAEQPPLVVMTKHVKQKPGLLLYEVQPGNHFQFQTKKAKELKADPKSLKISNETVYVKMKKDWYAFDKQLEEEQLNGEPQLTFVQEPYKINKVAEGYQLELNASEAQVITFQLEEKPQAVQLLNKKPKAWLVIFEENVSILTENTDK